MEFPAIRQRLAELEHQARTGAARLRALLAGPPRHVPLAVKLSMVIAATTTAVMLLLGTLVQENQRSLLRTQMQGFGHNLAEQLAESAKEPLLAEDVFALEVLASGLASSENVLGVAIIDARGRTVAKAGISPFDADAPYAHQLSSRLDRQVHQLDWRSPHGNGDEISAITLVRPITFLDVTAGFTVITLDRRPMERAEADAWRAIAAATTLIIILGVILSVAVGRHLTGPIAPLMDATRAIDRGHYHHRIRERRNDEIGNLIDAFNTMADGLLRKNQVEHAFSRYVSSNVAREVLANLDEVHLGGKRVDATVLFADIAGFTALAETLSPEQVGELLNEYFGHISRACEMHHGMVDKYIGDCAMLVFGVPNPDPEHSFHAIACAVLINRVVETLNARRAEAGLPVVWFRIGISSGSMLAGNMGSQDRMQYTVVGDTVNLASRLCAYAGARQIVIVRELRELAMIQRRVVATPHQQISLRGRSLAVETFLVDNLTAHYHGMLDEQAAQLLAGSTPALRS